MIPAGNFYSADVGNTFLHPWVASTTIAMQLGPRFIQGPSFGLLDTMWTAQIVDKTVVVSSDTTAPYVAFTHTLDIVTISIAFDQNGNLYLSFMDLSGDSYYYWWDALIPGYNLTLLTGEFPRLTLDDARGFNVANSDVVLVYVRDGVIRYRLQRDRFAIEYDPLDSDGNLIPASEIYHVSMTTSLRLTFVYVLDGALPQFMETGIMKRQVVSQKAPAEHLPVTFSFGHLMSFGEVIDSTAVVITVESGTDPSPSSMISGAATFTNTTITQLIVGGLSGNVYRIAMTAGTDTNSVYVVEGFLYVNDSPAVDPS